MLRAKIPFATAAESGSVRNRDPGPVEDLRGDQPRSSSRLSTQVRHPARAAGSGGGQMPASRPESSRRLKSSWPPIRSPISDHLNAACRGDHPRTRIWCWSAAKHAVTFAHRRSRLVQPKPAMFERLRCRGDPQIPALRASETSRNGGSVFARGR